MTSGTLDPWLSMMRSGRSSRLSAADAADHADRLAAVIDRLLDAVVTVDAWTIELIIELRHPVLTKFMTSVTGLGSATAAVVFLGVCYLAGWRRELAVGAVALSLAGVVVVALMWLVNRPFPPQPVCVTDGPGLAPHSFPSGHAAAVTIYALVSRRSEALPFGVVAGLAAVIAVSRVYLGTHFPSDTVAGVLIGGAAVLAGRRLLDRFGHRLPIPSERTPFD